MFGIDWMSLVLPFSYIIVLGGTFMTFSNVYRKRKATQNANLAPWFPPHLQRNVYLSLLHLDPEDGSEKAPKVPESVIRTALLRRAVEDIHRIIQIRTAKAACSSLLARGSVGDDLWQRFSRAEKEIEEELRDVVMEANALSPNWGQTIFQSANEIAANTELRKRLDEIMGHAETEKAWWAKRQGISGDEKPAVASPANASASVATTSKETTNSSDDGILVDVVPEAGTPVPAAAEPAQDTAPPVAPSEPGTPSGKKKKKGRK